MKREIDWERCWLGIETRVEEIGTHVINISRDAMNTEVVDSSGVQFERVNSAIDSITVWTFVVAAEVSLQVVPPTSHCLAAQQAQEHAGCCWVFSEYILMLARIVLARVGGDPMVVDD